MLDAKDSEIELLKKNLLSKEDEVKSVFLEMSKKLEKIMNNEPVVKEPKYIYKKLGLFGDLS